MSVPSNLIPTRITQLTEYTGSSTLGFVPYVLEGRTYKAQFANLATAGTVPSTRVIASGAGLTGGGDLSQDRTLAVSFSSSAPAPLGTAAAGVATTASREDHVHPALDLTNTDQTQGALPLGRGGTGDALSPAAGAVAYSSSSALALTASLIWDEANSRFGVGTAAPSSRLHVVANANANTATFEYTAGFAAVRIIGNVASQQQLLFGTTASTPGALIYDNASDTLLFNTASAEQMRLSATGLGVGVSPTHKLDVSGTARASNVIVSSIPTTDPSVTGQLWNAGGVAAVSGSALGLWDYWNENWFGNSTPAPSAGSMFVVQLLSSGTISTAPATAQAKGYNPTGVLVRSSTTTNSGYRATTGSTTSQYFGVIAQKFRAMLTPATAFTNNTIRAGWLDTASSTAPTTGAWLEMDGSGVWSAKCSAGGAVTTNGTTYASTIDVPLTLDVDVNAAGTSVRYRIYTGTSMTAVFDVTNTTNIPNSFATGTGSGLVATNVGTTASDICVLHALMQGTPNGFNRARG